MRAAVVLRSRAGLALGERVELLREAVDVDQVILATTPREVVAQLGSASVAYLLDVNALTARVAALLWARRRPYVIDTGDDPATLALASRGRPVALAQGSVEHLALRHALAVVCRGCFHQPILRSKTSVPVLWAPDTVPDELLDPAPTPGRDDLVASFGSAPAPRRGDRAYGWEVIDLVAADASLSGLLFVNGAGLAALQARATRLGVGPRVRVQGPCPLPELARGLGPAGFVTSVQSDDLAGWVRTTGKLPVALGLGKALVTTRVGEASRILPDSMLVTPGDDQQLVEGFGAAISRGIPRGWSETARELAERFRRSRVAAELGAFLGSL